MKKKDSIDPFDDLRRRLGIKDDEPASTSQSVAGTKSLGFLKTKQTTLMPKESGLGFYKKLASPPKEESKVEPKEPSPIKKTPAKVPISKMSKAIKKVAVTSPKKASVASKPLVKKETPKKKVTPKKTTPKKATPKAATPKQIYGFSQKSYHLRSSGNKN